MTDNYDDTQYDRRPKTVWGGLIDRSGGISTVPREPTEDMVNAGVNAAWHKSGVMLSEPEVANIYRTMIANAEGE